MSKSGESKSIKCHSHTQSRVKDLTFKKASEDPASAAVRWAICTSDASKYKSAYVIPQLHLLESGRTMDPLPVCCRGVIGTFKSRDRRIHE